MKTAVATECSSPGFPFLKALFYKAICFNEHSCEMLQAMHGLLHYAARFKMCLQVSRKVEPTDSTFRNHCDNVKVVKHIHLSVCCIRHFSGQTLVARKDDTNCTKHELVPQHQVPGMYVNQADSRANLGLKFKNLLEVLICSVKYNMEKDKDDAE